MESEAVVYGPYKPIPILKAVTRLSISVVRDAVEEGYPLQLLGTFFAKSEIAGPRIDFDELLQRAYAVRAFSNDCARDEIPGQMLGHQVGGILSFVQGARREIPKGLLSPEGLVYCFVFVGAIGYRYKECVI
jgi:hypothetical protein